MRPGSKKRDCHVSHSPAHHSQAWTPEEVDTLMRLMDDGTSPREIAKMLGRTRGAVTAKANAVRKSRAAQPSPGPDGSQA